MSATTPLRLLTPTDAAHYLYDTAWDGERRVRTITSAGIYRWAGLQINHADRLVAPWTLPKAAWERIVAGWNQVRAPHAIDPIDPADETNWSILGHRITVLT